MKKLLVLVLVAVVCLPCYGRPPDNNILVYKFTCNFSSWMDFEDSSWSSAVVGTKKVDGYLVLDIDLYDPNDPFLVYDPVIFFYGKDGTYKWYTYFELDKASLEAGFYMFDIDKKGKEGIYLYVDEENDEDIVGNVRCDLYGKISSVDIGKYVVILTPPYILKVKKPVPSSLKGTVAAWLQGLGDNFEGFGTMTATLDSKLTKAANKVGDSQSVTAGKIKDDLHAKGYL
jgi:hypothetical protein